MDYLYIVVLSLSLIMLIVFLIVFGAMLYTKQEVNPFPPVPNTCPDFWPEINGNCLYLPDGVDKYETYLKNTTDSNMFNDWHPTKPDKTAVGSCAMIFLNLDKFFIHSVSILSKNH